MSKIFEKPSKRDAERAAIVKRTARITGVSERQVNRVLDTENSNDLVVSVFMEIKESNDQTDNKLLEAVKTLIPFN